MDKFVIYQLLPRLFGNTTKEPVHNGSLEENGSGTFENIDSKVLAYFKKLSVSYIWLTGIIKHSTGEESFVKGKAGSPYAIKDYYDLAPYLAKEPENRMEEFESLLQRAKEADLKVLIDFVPNHLSRSYGEGFDDSNFYPGRICDGDWTDTVKLNYGHEGAWNYSTWVKMRDILLFWASKGVDGFRCDMVELVPVQFWAWALPTIKSQYPSCIFVAEIYNPSNYASYLASGFDYLYDKDDTYDTLRAVSRGERSASSITYCWQHQGDFQHNMLKFLENHDEQRLASEFFLGDARRGFAALYVSLFLNTSPFMLYFGQEFGEKAAESEGFSGKDGRTSIFDFTVVPSVRRALLGESLKDEQELCSEYISLLSKATRIPAFSKGETYDLQYVNHYSSVYDPYWIFSFLRFYEGEFYLCVVNFSNEEREVEVNIPNNVFVTSPVKVKVGANNGTIVQLASNA